MASERAFRVRNEFRKRRRGMAVRGVVVDDPEGVDPAGACATRHWCWCPWTRGPPTRARERQCRTNQASGDRLHGSAGGQACRRPSRDPSPDLEHDTDGHPGPKDPGEDHCPPFEPVGDQQRVEGLSRRHCLPTLFVGAVTEWRGSCGGQGDGHGDNDRRQHERRKSRPEPPLAPGGSRQDTSAHLEPSVTPWTSTADADAETCRDWIPMTPRITVGIR